MGEEGSAEGWEGAGAGAVVPGNRRVKEVCRSREFAIALAPMHGGQGCNTANKRRSHRSSRSIGSPIRNRPASTCSSPNMRPSTALLPDLAPAAEADSDFQGKPPCRTMEICTVEDLASESRHGNWEDKHHSPNPSQSR